MKQIIQNLGNGETMLEEVPTPAVRRGHLLIRSKCSLVSLGTEKMLVNFGKSNLINKARQQPEKVRQVLEKVKTEGLMTTIQAVRNKLDDPIPLGYSNAGEVIAVGEGVTNFQVGDRVVSNGPHAEVVCVPVNLCAHIPDNVSYEEASFTVVGSIGLQGIRLAEPTFGETIIVIGLGLIGQITCQLLLANGCRVVGFDLDPHKVKLAEEAGVLAYAAAGADEQVKLVEEITDGLGADAVLLTVSTKSNEVVSSAAKMSRKKGRIILVGVTGLELDRNDFYKKELSFQVSCSYGPGRYDPLYEDKGIDYPAAYVRWTEKRNFDAILHALSSGRVRVEKLITEKFPIEKYSEIYNSLGSGSIASLLTYGNTDDSSVMSRTIIHHASPKSGRANCGFIGAGNFTKMTMLPAMNGLGYQLNGISSANGLSAKMLAKKYGFKYSTSDYNEILQDKDIDLVAITTRHNMHAPLVEKCLDAGKHVFVEKPLAITDAELDALEAKYEATGSGSIIHVGFNRRFSPYAVKAKQILGRTQGTLSMVATFNAGHIPNDVWVHDMATGGGRIIGEACHFIDLMSFFTDAPVVSVYATALGLHPAENSDNVIINLKFSDGSHGVLNYFANGSKAYPKERIEVYEGGRTLVIDNFRRMEGFGFKGFSSMRSSQDKGHKNQFELLRKHVETGIGPLIPFNILVNTTRASIAAVESFKTGRMILLNP
jgi:predicted dehydrogenase/threonine dehydrogenase-like Zn-dependent dehydrogenase